MVFGISGDNTGREGGDEQSFEAEGAETAEAVEAERLDLDDGEEHLPWLESDDDYEEPKVDTGRIAVFAIVGLLVICLIIGVIWWSTSRQEDPALVADGSTIEASDAPYKTKPDEPGGKTFDGTGDTSFAVAEGQSRDGTLATDEAPGPNAVSDNAGNTPAAEQAASATAGVGVQVGAYSTRATAVQGWSSLTSKFADLQSMKYRVVEGQADIGTVYRLQAVAPDLAAAKSLCASLKASGGACQVKQ